MADAVVGATIQVVLKQVLPLALDQIGLLALDQICLFRGFKKDLQKLKISAEMIQKLLADAENKQSDERVQFWLKKLQGVVYDTYYVLDELNYQDLRRKVKSRHQLKGKVCTFFFLSKDNISFRWRMVSKVRNTNLKLKNIYEEATNQYGLIQNFAPSLLTPSTQADPNGQTDSVVDPIVVGRKKDVFEIVKRLLSPSTEVVSVIPIVGMGGLGKTTLAKSVFNNQEIDGHFSKKIWVYVSKKFEKTKLFQQILESLTGEKVELSNLDVVVQETRKKLDGKRYLLVLDDVWNEKQGLWDSFLNSLVGISTASGSKCLVTTRLYDTASIVSRHPLHKLSELSDDECWTIIKKKVIESGEIPEEELIGIRSHVVQKCDGLPLAANVIGGLLRRFEKHEWQSVVEDKLLNINSDHGEVIDQILKLSFDNLPSPSIKKCFAYCSSFDKDTELERDRLIELWMAEGFLQPDPKYNERFMEETGERYFSILLRSSLLEKGGIWEDRYKMHDLVHDLAQRVSKFQRFNSENDVMNSITDDQVRVRHLALDTRREIMTLNDASVLILKRISISDEEMWMFKRLHILNLSGAEITELPTSIGKLKHLRFLDVSCCRIKSLPESICKLYNLQTLYIDDDLEGFPQGMSNLISLRHLHCYSYSDEIQMPPEMRRLTCLQTLEFYNIGEEKGRQIEELGGLEFLKGRLDVRNLKLVKSKEEAERANLCGKQNLTGLNFFWGRRGPEGVGTCDAEVLEGLKPHQNLKELSIKGFMGDRFPQWLSNLSRLVKLTFKGSQGCKEVPILWHLPCLETLELSNLGISCIGVSFYGLDDCRGRLGSRSSCGEGQVGVSKKNLFPALKKLKLRKLSSLVEWEEAKVVSDDCVVFPLLENLKISSCPQLMTAPTSFPCLKSLKIEDVQLSVVRRILSEASSTLEVLRLGSIDGLTCLSDLPLGCFASSIKELCVLSCSNLIEFTEGLCQLDSLRLLMIFNCSKLLQVGPPPSATNHLTSIEDFSIDGCQCLTSITKETLERCTSLSSLQVTGCPDLISFPLDLRKSPSLSDIGLENCPKLFADQSNPPRGFDHLTNLQSLSIGPFLNDDSSTELFHGSGLMSCSSTLRHLKLYGLGHMDSLLPNQFQHFTSLEELSLVLFESLETLPDWLGSLASLRELRIRYSPNLRCLPSLPAMRRLTNLRSLRLYQCPLLEERCSPGCGSDSEWFKISQLPNLKIVFDW